MLAGMSASLRDHPIEFMDSRNELEAILIDVVGTRSYRVSLQIYVCTARRLETLNHYQTRVDDCAMGGGRGCSNSNSVLVDRAPCRLRDAELMRDGNGRFRADDLLWGKGSVQDIMDQKALCIPITGKCGGYG